MEDHFATAMGRALEQTRAGNPADATRTILAGLSARGHAGNAGVPPRRPFGRTIDMLAHGRRPRTRPAGTSTQPEVPVGALFDWRRHGSAHGSRDFRLFVPSGQDEPVRAVILMLHGCTQDPDDFAIGTGMNLLAERRNVIVLYPRQPRSSNGMSCWNWFRPEDQRRGAGEPALLASLTAAVSQEFGVPDTAIFAAGFSAGGAMAAILASEYPDLFSAAGVHSGLAPGAALDLPGAYAAMGGQPLRSRRGERRPAPTIAFHGTADTTVAETNARAVIDHATAFDGATIIEERAVTGATCAVHRDAKGRVVAEDWRVAGMGHAWSGGAAAGSYTCPEGPDATAEMIRFFLETAAGARP